MDFCPYYIGKFWELMTSNLQINTDLSALLNLVRVVHDTLRDLSLRSTSRSLDVNTRDPRGKPLQT